MPQSLDGRMATQEEPSLHSGTRDAGPSGGDQPLVPAIARAAAVIDLVAECLRRPPLGPTELARRLGLPKSSVAVICTELAQAGYLRRDGGGYQLGHRLAELGASYLAGIDEVTAFYQSCSEVSPPIQETAQLATLDSGLEVTYLARRDGTCRVRLMSAIGRHLPATCTATGKVLLAALPEADLARRSEGVRLQRLTSRSITTHAQLLDELRSVRAQGWAVDDEETTEGVLCLAAPIPDPWGQQHFAISFTMLRARATADRRERLTTDLLRLATSVANRLGRVPSGPRCK